MPEHKRDKLLELLQTTDTVRSDFKREAVVYWSEENYNELDDQVKNIIIRNKSLGADTNVLAMYPPRCSPEAQARRRCSARPDQGKVDLEGAPKELGRWGSQIPTFEKQEELKKKRIAKLKKATDQIGQKSKMVGAFKPSVRRTSSRATVRRRGTRPPSPTSCWAAPQGARLGPARRHEKSAEERRS